MSNKVRNRRDELVAALRESRAISLGDRDDLIEILEDAADGTNGLTLAEKIQANADNVFALCYLVIRERLERPATPATWRDVAIRCRWAIVAALAVVAALLVFRPELGGLLASLARR